MSMDEIYQMPFAAKFLADIDRLWEVAATNTGCGSSMHEGEVQPLFDITSADELVLVVSALTTDANCGLDYYKSKADLLIKEQSFRENIHNLYKEGFANLNAYDTERIEALIQWVVDTQKVFCECWGCPQQNIMSELIQLFYPLGITVPVLKACMTANVEDVKAAIGSDVINADINNVLLQHSLAMLLQVFAAARNVERLKDWGVTTIQLDFDHETVKRINAILAAYREFVANTETYPNEYKDFLSRVVALRGLNEICLEGNLYRGILLDFVQNRLYWKPILLSYFNIIYSSTAPNSTKELILSFLIDYAGLIADEYAKFCDEKNIALNERLPMLLTYNAETETMHGNMTDESLQKDEQLRIGRPYFDKAVEKGLMVKISDHEYKWQGGTDSLLVYFCGRIYCGDYTEPGKSNNEHDIWVKGDRDRRLPSTKLRKIFNIAIDMTNLRTSRLSKTKPTSPLGHHEIDQIIEEVNSGE